jgi:hypothetical protein
VSDMTRVEEAKKMLSTKVMALNYDLSKTC